jgi:hypothetical protein
LVKQRLADEYGAAQERGEIKSAGNPNSSKTEELPGVSDIDGLTHKDIYPRGQYETRCGGHGRGRLVGNVNQAARTKPCP